MLKYSLIERTNPKTGINLYYANLTGTTPLTIEAFSSKVCQECHINPVQLLNTLYYLEKEIIDALLNGHSVRLGDIGSFHLTLSSTGAESNDSFSEENLRGLKVRFVPTSKMRKEFDLNNPKVALLREEG